MIAGWKTQAKKLKQETYALFLAYRHPHTPWYAKLLAGVVAAYAFSPIDLIPDFIPILGYLDDLVLVPLGIALALRLIPPEVMDESHERARSELEKGKPVNQIAAAVIILVWLSIASLGVLLVARILAGE